MTNLMVSIYQNLGTQPDRNTESIKLIYQHHSFTTSDRRLQEGEADSRRHNGVDSFMAVEGVEARQEMQRNCRRYHQA